MDIVKHQIEILKPENLRAKTSLRMIYEAEARSIQRQTGDLESIRSRLGMSARRLCQTLLVDPSAWTRWRKEGAPPHIWRSLQWYLELQEKVVGLAPLEKNQPNPESLIQIEQVEEMQRKINQLEIAVKVNRWTAMVLGAATLLMAWAVFRLLRSP